MKCFVRVRRLSVHSRRRTGWCAAGCGTGRTRRCRSRLAHRPERGLGTVLLWLLGPRGRSRFGPCRIAGPLVPDGRCSDRVCPDQDVIETRVPPFLPRMSSLIEPLYSRTCMETADGPQATAAATVEPGMHTQLVIASGAYSAVGLTVAAPAAWRTPFPTVNFWPFLPQCFVGRVTVRETRPRPSGNSLRHNQPNMAVATTPNIPKAKEKAFSGSGKCVSS